MAVSIRDRHSTTSAPSAALLLIEAVCELRHESGMPTLDDDQRQRVLGRIDDRLAGRGTESAYDDDTFVDDVGRVWRLRPPGRTPRPKSRNAR